MVEASRLEVPLQIVITEQERILAHVFVHARRLSGQDHRPSAAEFRDDCDVSAAAYFVECL
jgi:hypothetical protein